MKAFLWIANRSYLRFDRQTGDAANLARVGRATINCYC